MNTPITVVVSSDVYDALQAIGDPAAVLLHLAEEAARGVTLPTSMERRFVEQAFGDHFLHNIEQHPVLRWRQRHKKPGGK